MKRYDILLRVKETLGDTLMEVSDPDSLVIQMTDLIENIINEVKSEKKIT
jgi:hypothetical protein